MRSDWPMVPDEDCIEPPCEIFLQLFIQNVEIAVGDNPDENNDDYDFPFGNGGELNEQDADELIENFGPILIEDDSYTDDSDDSLALSLPSLSVTDAELTPSSDEVESETESYCDELHNGSLFNQNSPSTPIEARCEEVSSSPNVLDYEYEQEANLSDTSSAEIPVICDVDSTRIDLNDCSEEIPLLAHSLPRRESRCSDLIDEMPQTHSRREPKHLDLIDESEEVSLKPDVHSRRELKSSNRLDESEDIPLVTDVCPRRSSRCSEMDSTTDRYSRSENFEVAGHSDIYQDSENYFDEISSKDVSLPSRIPRLEDSSSEFKASVSNNSLQPSTHVSLYVVVPPTSFSNETGSNLSSEVSTNLSGLYLPICQYPSSFTYDDGNFQLDNILNQNSTRSLDSSNELASFCTSAISDTNNKKSNFSDTDCLSSNPVFEPKLESNSFDNRHPELPVCGTLSEETEKNSNKEMSDKYVSNLKRKVNSVDDSVLNKVPKYSASQTSSDSVNQISLDCCKVLNNNSENTLQTSHEDEKVDIVTPSVTSDVILTMDKSVERTSVVNEKPKCR